MISNPEEVMIRAVRNATRRANPALEKILETHLEIHANAKFELAFRDPKKFKELVNKLFGEYSGRLLEMLIVEEVKKLVGIDENVDSLEDAVEILKLL